MKNERFDRKLAELAEVWSAAPDEVQEMLYALVSNLVSAAHATAPLARVKDPRPFLATALGHYADRKEDPKAHPIGRKEARAIREQSAAKRRNDRVGRAPPLSMAS